MWLRVPVLKIMPGSGKWELYEPAVYHSLQYNQRYTVHAGFKTDLASIPRALRWLFPVDGKHRMAAILYDWLYANMVAQQRMTRRKADELFLEAMSCSQVPAYTALPMYYAVRLFGGAHV